MTTINNTPYKILDLEVYDCKINFTNAYLNLTSDEYLDDSAFSYALSEPKYLVARFNVFIYGL